MSEHVKICGKHVKRLPKGDAHPRAVLTDGEVELMRRLHAQGGMGYDRLAAKFEVTKSCVQKIITYQRR